MDLSLVARYAPTLGFVLLGAWAFRAMARQRAAQGARVRALLAAGAQVVDVRTPAEFAAGHRAGSVNLPLVPSDPRGSLAAIAERLEANRPVVVVCASGARSAAVVAHLAGTKRFPEVVNGGSWRTLRP